MSNLRPMSFFSPGSLYYLVHLYWDWRGRVAAFNREVAVPDAQAVYEQGHALELWYEPQADLANA